MKQQQPVGWWDRNGRTVALWVCVICVLIGVLGGIYVAVNLIGNIEVSTTKGPGSTPGSDPTTASKTTTTEAEAPFSCEKYEKDESANFIKKLNKTEHKLPEGEVCLCRAGTVSNESLKVQGDKILDEVKKWLKKDGRNLGKPDVEFNEKTCLKKTKKREVKEEKTKEAENEKTVKCVSKYTAKNVGDD